MMSNPLDINNNNHPNNSQKLHQPKQAAQQQDITELQVHLLGQEKTIQNPSKDLHTLANQVKLLFKELNSLSFAEDSTTEEVGQGEFAIAWIDNPNGIGGDPQEIMINDNDQLDEIYLMHAIKHSKLHLQIMVQEDSIKSQEPAQSLMINVEEFKSCYPHAHGEAPTASQMDLLAEKFQLAAAKQSHVLDEIQSQCSEEFLNEESSSLPPLDSSQDYEGYKSSNDEDEDQIQVIEAEENKNDNSSSEKRQQLDDSPQSSASSDEDVNSDDQIILFKDLKTFIQREIEQQVSSLLKNSGDKEVQVTGQEVKQLAYIRYDLDLINGAPIDVSQVQVQVLDQSLKVSSDHEVEEQKEEEPDTKPQYMQMYASMTKSKVEEKPQQPQPELNSSQQQQLNQSQGPMKLLKQSQMKIQPLIQGFKNLFKQPLPQPNDRNLFAMIQGQQEIFVDDAQTDTYCKLEWNVKNHSQVFWPPGVQLDLVYSHPLSIMKPQAIQGSLAPGESQDIQVNIFLPKDIKEAHQIVIFRLRHQHTGYLGQALIGFIRLKHEIFEKLRESSAASLKSSLSRRSQSFEELDDEKLLGMASILVDEGYGSFDRCYSLIRVLRGDINKAKEVGSQLIFYEMASQSE